LSSGEVVVLSHSLGASGEMWKAQTNEFGKRFRLLIPDHRGHGQSSVPAGPYGIDQCGRELVALLDHLELDRVHFCGLSWGGMIGMWLGQHALQRIQRMVLCNTAARIVDTTLLMTRNELIQREGLSAIADNVIDRWFTPAFRGSHPEEVESARKMLLGTSPEGYVHTSSAVCELDLREGLPTISCPVLVVAGKHDLATPPGWNASIASSIPGAQFVELDAAHLSNIEARHEFNRTVINFLSVEK
jgi:3-oxoadipate enol-lactonase